MKKGLLALILAVAMAAPAFAAKGDMSINAKFGVGVSNNLNAHSASDYDSMPDGYSEGYDMDMSASIGAEFFYGLMDNLSIGGGINYNFDSTPKGEIRPVVVKPINFYLAVKPEVKIESDIFSSMYLIGQIGGSSITLKNRESWTTDVGIYLGFGAGTIIKDCFIVELLISSSNGSFSEDGEKVDYQYTATTLNVGYKFNI